MRARMSDMREYIDSLRDHFVEVRATASDSALDEFRDNAVQLARAPGRKDLSNHRDKTQSCHLQIK